ncbi:MAG: S8 family serine peptidase [Bifidobacteriaceae bacterium]|nr:S8 family serine peptidase [Bifidobacteriaceae bacterium]
MPIPSTAPKVRILAALVAAIALGVPPTLGAAAAPTTTNTDDAGVSADACDGPLADPSDPWVDPSRVVALAKDGVTPGQIRAQARSTARRVAPSAAVLEGDPAASRVVVVHTAPGASAEVIETMVESGLYQAVDYDLIRYSYATRTPNDPLYASDPQYLYGLRSGPEGSHFDEAWAAATNLDGTAANALMGWIDAGFDLDHEDLGDNITPVWDYGENDADISPDTSDPDDDHGAMTLSVAAARANNSIGALGAAWNNTALAYKVAESDGGMPSSALASAIINATDRGAKVINMSLGGPGTNSVETNAVRYAFARDVTLVASSGNSGDEFVDGQFNPVNYPAAFPEVISVGATDAAGAPTEWSSYNSEVDIAAAGDDVLVASDRVRGGYDVASGTSFSAPLVTAAVALMLREKPGLSPTQVHMILAETATDVTQAPATAGPDDYTGYGILNARAALERARTIEPLPSIAVSADQVVIAAGQPFSVSVTASGYPAPIVRNDPATPLPAGIAITGGTGAWTLSGTSTTPGTYAMTLVADSAGRQRSATVMLVVQPGPPASFSFPLPAAMRNSTKLVLNLTATDAYGNATAPAGEPVTYTYSIAPECRFKKGAKPSYRRCAVTAQVSTGVLASGTIDVYDTSKFTKPKVTGTVKPGRKIKASIPKGWKHLTYQWYKNGKAIKGATARTYTIPKKISAKATYKVKVTIPGVASKVAKAVKIR